MNRNDNRMQVYLLLIIAILVLVTLLCAVTLGVLSLIPTPTPQEEPTETDSQSGQDTSVSVSPQEVILGETEDAGMTYIDSMIFFGESTTAHFRSRGVLSGGRDTHQVWEDDSGTKTLSSKLLSETINYPPTGEKLTLSQALEKEKPAYIVLSFGLNGISGFMSNKATYVNNYNRLIKAIQAASPNTRIILQSVYPVTADCDAWNESGTQISEYTKTLNQWLPEIAAAHENVRFVDTASVLTDVDGCLDKIYDFNGDGIHLTTEAYEKILYYLRTHAWKSN